MPMGEGLPDFPTVERLLGLLRNGFDAELEVLARDICFYARELQRTRPTPTVCQIATA
ncbi:hypothetical protein [Armatimonas sp.]|uniref:hypothetical protein n=1 Tax=Armatimonas sp. TaxID=1872638 RepID=UPI003752635E